jgi:gluconolactonase
MRLLSLTLISAGVVACSGSNTGAGPEGSAPAGTGTIVRIDPRFDALVPLDATIEKVADGFVFIEGPVWLRDENRLLFSDVQGNTIYQWSEAQGASVFLQPVYDGDTAGLRGVGSNGLTLDSQGRLVMCEHGNRRVSRLEADGTRTILADNFRGRRLNSPNDAVYGSDGSLYFTDPPYGLEDFEESPLREVDVNGVYRLRPNGALELLTGEMSRPNGIALSPDESTLYVANSGETRQLWMAYDVGPGGLSNARIFFDATAAQAEMGEGGADGLKVDSAGNIFATGPGGVWVFAPDGTNLGVIRPDEVPANVAWGDDGHTLYMTARTGLYRIRLATSGPMP